MFYVVIIIITIIIIMIIGHPRGDPKPKQAERRGRRREARV